MKNKTFKNDLMRTIAPFIMLNAVLSNDTSFNSPGRKGKHRDGKSPKRPLKNIVKVILTPEEITIKRMTNWQNHQWMKARAKNYKIAPDKFAAMVRPTPSVNDAGIRYWS